MKNLNPPETDEREIIDVDLDLFTDDEIDVLLERVAGATQSDIAARLRWSPRRARRAWRSLAARAPQIAARARRRRPGSSLRPVFYERIRGRLIPDFASVLLDPVYAEIMSQEYLQPVQALPKHFHEKMFGARKLPQTGIRAIQPTSASQEIEMAKQQAPETAPAAGGGVLPTSWDSEIQQVSAKLEKLHRQRSGIEEQRRQQAARVDALEQQLQALRVSLDEEGLTDRIAAARRELTNARETLSDLKERGDSFDALRASLMRELADARSRAAAACHPVVLSAFRDCSTRMFRALEPVLQLAAELRAIEAAAVEAGVHLGLEKWPMSAGADPLWALSPDQSQRLRLAAELQRAAVQ